MTAESDIHFRLVKTCNLTVVKFISVTDSALLKR